jgi:hypothetical protein
MISSTCLRQRGRPSTSSAASQRTPSLGWHQPEATAQNGVIRTPGTRSPTGQPLIHNRQGVLGRGLLAASLPGQLPGKRLMEMPHWFTAATALAGYRKVSDEQ